MSAICQVTGRKPGFVNVQRRKFFVPSLGRTVTLTVSTKGLKVIDRDGIEAVVAQIRARGEKV